MPDLDPLPITLAEAGAGRPVLVLHGGGGPATVAGLAAHLARTARVLTPTHPGWDGTPRPAWCTSIGDLASAYLDLLARHELEDVLVVGSSLGGWIAAEMAVRDADGRVGALVLIDAVGIAVPEAPIRDFFALDARGVAEHAFHDSERFFVDPAAVPAEQAARQRENLATMRVYAGDPYMHDPALRARLAEVRVPALVLWGEADGIVTPEYGRAYAAALAGAQFTLLPASGHLPHIETPEAAFAAIDAFCGARP